MTNFSPLLRQCSSEYSSWCPIHYKVFHSGWWKSELFLALCQLLQWFCFFQWLFPWRWVVSSHECIDLYSAEDSRVTLCKTLQLSLFTSLYLNLTCLVFYPANFSCLGFLEFSTLFPQPGRPLSSISVCPACIVAWKLQIVGVYHLFFLSQGLLSYAAYCSESENCCFMYIVWFYSCLRQISLCPFIMAGRVICSI